MVNATETSAFKDAFSGIDFTKIGKGIIFLGYYINDLFIRLFTAIFKSLNLPFTSFQSAIVLSIIYMISLYVVLIVLENLKPIVKWAIVVAIIWLILGFFRF